MHCTTFTRSTSGWFLLAVAGFLSTVARGDVIWVNPAADKVTGDPLSGVLAAHARYRVDHNNWDALLARDHTPGNGNDLGTLHLGNNSGMHSIWFNFTLDYHVGSGFSFALVNTGTGSQQLVNWSGALPGSFNTLNLEARGDLHGVGWV